MLTILKQLIKNDFVRDVSKLSLGTLLARVIVAASLPFTTRLYSPEDFSLLSVYLGIVTLIAGIACLRLDIAIPIVEKDDESASLFILSLISAFSISLILALFVLLFPQLIIGLIGIPDLAPFLWMIPLGVLISAGYSACQYWATRRKRFNFIAITRITQSISNVGTTLTLGWFSITPFGLLLGNMLNAGAGILKLGFQAFSNDKNLFKKITFRSIIEALHKNKYYPIYSTPECLLNIAGAQIPIILIASQSSTEAGYLFLAMQIMYIPMTLLSGSIAQVYISRAPEKFKKNTLKIFTLNTMSSLARISIGPFILMGIIAPVLCSLVFGDTWLKSGEIIQWLVPWIILQLIASPVSMSIYVRGQYRLMLGLTIFGCFIRVAPLLIATTLQPQIDLFTIFAVSSTI